MIIDYSLKEEDGWKRRKGDGRDNFCFFITYQLSFKHVILLPCCTRHLVFPKMAGILSVSLLTMMINPGRRG